MLLYLEMVSLEQKEKPSTKIKMKKQRQKHHTSTKWGMTKTGHVQNGLCLARWSSLYLVIFSTSDQCRAANYKLNLHTPNHYHPHKPRPILLTTTPPQHHPRHYHHPTTIPPAGTKLCMNA